MTASETRLREALHEAGSVPVASVDFDALAQRHRSRGRTRWVVACAGTLGAAAFVIWAGTSGGDGASNATLVPAAPPTVQVFASPSALVGSAPRSAAEIPPRLGILNDVPGQFHASWFTTTNVWVEQLARGQALYVWGGGQPLDATLEQSTATTAGVLVVTPKDQGPGAPLMSNGTRYPAPGSPVGKLTITAASGHVLTLQLVGTGTTYTFDTDTDTYG